MSSANYRPVLPRPDHSTPTQSEETTDNPSLDHDKLSQPQMASHPFVNLSGTFQLGPTMKTQVKSTVSKWRHTLKYQSSLSSRTSKQLPIIQPEPVPNANDGESRKGSNSKELVKRDLTTARKGIIEYKPRIATGLGSRGSEALYIVPQEFNAPTNAPSLLCHYCEVFVPYWYDLPAGITLTTWAVGGNTNPVTFLIQLCLAATHIAQLNGQNVSRQAIELRSLALKGINETLQDIKTGTSDETMLAIMSLCAYELVYGDTRAWKCHMDGLSLIIAHRGGFDSLKSNPKVQLLMSCFDAMLACVLNTELKYSISVLSSSLFSSASLLYDTSSHPVLGDLNTSLRKIAYDLCILSTSVSMSGLGARLYRSWLSTRKMINDMFHRLLIRCDVNDVHYKFNELCRMAMLIHLCGILQSYSEFRKIRSGENVKGVRRLMSDISGTWVQDGLGDLKLWVLFVGLSDSADLDDWSWFANELKMLIPPSSYLSRWNDIENVLKQFWWAGGETAQRYEAVHKKVFQ